LAASYFDFLCARAILSCRNCTHRRELCKRQKSEAWAGGRPVAKLPNSLTPFFSFVYDINTHGETRSGTRPEKSSAAGCKGCDRDMTQPVVVVRKTTVRACLVFKILQNFFKILRHIESLIRARNIKYK
jgi:hypothetical protein